MDAIIIALLVVSIALSAASLGGGQRWADEERLVDRPNQKYVD